MPLEVLLTLVVGGIAGIALALHLLGLSRPFRLDMENFRDAWLRHYPDDTFEVNFEFLMNEAQNRIILQSDQSYGLLWVMGADTSARRLDGNAITQTRAGVRFHFDDPAAPHIDVALTPGDKTIWLPYLRKFHGL